MRKILALALAMMLVLACTAALATVTEGYTPVENRELGTVEKLFTGAETIPQGVTIELEETDADVNHAANPDTDATVSVTSFTTKDDGSAADDSYVFTFTLDSANKPGKYHFTFQEVDPEVLGLTPSTATINVNFLVTFNADGALVVEDDNISFGVLKDGIKETEIENKFENGKLTVSKTVTGNIADKSQSFEITVTFETVDGAAFPAVTVYAVKYASDDENKEAKDSTTYAISADQPSITFELMDNETIEFSNLPAGMTYEVAEADKHNQATDEGHEEVLGRDGSKGYTVTYSSETGSISADAAAEASVTNEKKIEIDTGITLENLPYMLIMAIALVGAAMLITRRREEM